MAPQCGIGDSTTVEAGPGPPPRVQRLLLIFFEKKNFFCFFFMCLTFFEFFFWILLVQVFDYRFRFPVVQELFLNTDADLGFVGFFFLQIQIWTFPKLIR